MAHFGVKMMLRRLAGMAVALVMVTATGEAQAQQQDLLEKLKAMAGQYSAQAGVAQLKANAQAAYANSEKEWATCKAMADVKARAACYERVHDHISAMVAGYLK